MCVHSTFNYYLLLLLEHLYDHSLLVRDINKTSAKNEIKCSKTLEMLTVAYGECTLRPNNIFEWDKLFTEGQEDLNDDVHTGRCSISISHDNVEKLKKVTENCRITINEIAEDIGISLGSFHAITKLLNFTKNTSRSSSVRNCRLPSTTI